MWLKLIQGISELLGGSFDLRFVLGEESVYLPFFKKQSHSTEGDGIFYLEHIAFFRAGKNDTSFYLP